MTLPSPDRRTFLAALVAAATGAACSSDDGGDSAVDATTTTGPRRTTTTTEAGPLPELSADPFRLGVASGDPLPTSVILWTRLVADLDDPRGGVGDGDLEVAWEVATDDTFSTLVASGRAPAPAVLGHSVHVDVDGLEPDSWYAYRFRVANHTSPTGRTRTLPDAAATPERLRLAFASCQDYTNGYYSAHRAMAADELDLVLFLGDYIYEYGGAGTGDRAVRPTREIISLDDYRLRYATYKSDPDLQAAHARCPWMVTWDDHEVENNYAAGTSEDGAPAAEFDARRAAAYQAYYEHQPLRLEPPTGSDWRIFRSARFGTLADLFLLDGRQYRTDQACNSAQDALVQAASCPELGEEERTMLGPEQESWLADGLAESPATWKVIAQQTVMSSLVLGTLILNVDQWDGYPAARDRLLGFVRAQGIDGVVVLTGDIHSAGAGVLSTTGPDGATVPVAVEFVGTSITSSTLAGIVPGGERLLNDDTFPGIEYLNVRDHGYARCTVTPDEWRTEYVMVESIDRADAPTRIDATLVVPPGATELRRV